MSDEKSEARKQADAWMAANANQFALRSCWNCNPSHKHLKCVGYVINCFECGHWFFQGIDVTTF